jgi:hypothetical protein
MSRRLFIALAAVVALTSESAVAASTSAELVPAVGIVDGHSYGYWEAAAFRWRVSLPNVTPNKGLCFSAGQAGPIWFLGGSVFNCLRGAE